MGPHFVVARVKVVLSGSTVLEAVLHGVLFYRQSKASMSESSEVKGGPQQPPWTTSEGSTGLRTVITDQVLVYVHMVVPECNKHGVRTGMWERDYWTRSMEDTQKFCCYVFGCLVIMLAADS